MKARTVFVGLWLTVTLTCSDAATPLFANNTSVVVAVDSIGMTVSDMDRSVAFYSDMLAFKPISDVEVDGPEYDQLWGIFGVRARVVRMQLGEQQLELIEFLAPPTLAFTYLGSSVLSAQWPLIAVGAAMVLFFLAMPKLLTRYRTGAFARLFLGPPPVPTLASTRRVEIPLQVRCTGCGATMPTA